MLVWTGAIIPVVVLFAILIGVAAPRITNKPDTMVEETAEDIIYITTHQEIDFSADLKKRQTEAKKEAEQKALIEIQKGE